MKLRTHVFRIAAVSAVLAPFAMSVLGHALGETTSKSIAAERPALAFREYMLNLGRVPEGQPVPAKFWFTNTGDRPLKILGSTPSCGCLTPKLKKIEYAPGEQGAMLVVADTASASFSERNNETSNLDQVKEHFVDIKYDAGQGEQFARVNLKFVLPARRITVEPRALMVYQTNDQPTEREIIVTDRRSPPIVVTKVESLSDSVLVSSELTTDVTDPTRARIAVTITAPDKTVWTAIRVHTNDPDQPQIQVPIKIDVPANGPMRLGRTPLDLVPRDAVHRQ